MNKIHLIYMICLLSILMTNTVIAAETDVPVIVSEGAILVDGDTGQILYEKNAHTSFAPASITKLMTALLTIESLAPGDSITFSRNAVMSIERGSSHIGMRENETISVEDALHGLLLQSANEVANGLAEAVSGSIENFALAMNERAAELGAQGTHFVNPNGLYDENHYTTAYDMTLITRELLQHDYFLEVMSHYSWQIPPTNIVDEIRYLRQGHKLLNPKRDPKLFREDVIAGKSGYTSKSGSTLVTVAKRGTRTLISVSLKTDGSHLYSDTNQLLDYGFEAFDAVTIMPSDYRQVLSVSDEHNTLGEATIAPEKSVTVLVPAGTEKDAITFQTALPNNLTNGISVNQVIGELALFLDDQSIGSVPLTINAIDLDDLPEAVPQTEIAPDTDTDKPDEAPPGNKVNYLWFIVAALLIIGLVFLYFLNKATYMNYSEYKRQRDEAVFKPAVKDESPS